VLARHLERGGFFGPNKDRLFHFCPLSFLLISAGLLAGAMTPRRSSSVVAALVDCSILPRRSLLSRRSL
jgi:hypothetical protein